MRLFVAAYCVGMLWRAYPGLTIAGTTFFLLTMIVLFFALPLVRSDDVSALRLWGWWFLYAFGFVFFAMLRSFADEGRPVYYTYPIHFGQSLFGTPVSVYLQRVLPDPTRHDPFTILMVATYVSFFAVPTVVALYLGRRRPEAFSRYVIATLAMYVIGLIGFRLFPTAPPWMAARDGFIPPIYRIDALIIHPGSYAQGLHLIGANDVAAMPSIHIAQTWLAIFGLWFRGRLARVLGVLYGLTMMFTVVYLGEHWVLDVIVGFSISCVIWYLTRNLAALKWPALRRLFSRNSLPQQI